MASVLAYFGSGVIFLWGVGHLLPTRSVVSGFGQLTPDNARIITMEWLAEGLTLCFIGGLVGSMMVKIGLEQPATVLVLRACAAMLATLAVLSTLTGARTSVMPMKLCPYVKTVVAIIFVFASFGP